jgi:ribonuclease R
MDFVANFGYTVRGGKTNVIHPRALQTLLEQIHGTPEQTVIGTMMLRSMKQAKYDATNLGHFGLAAEYYTHFTSPIRRYPDLVIHRVIREVILANNALQADREAYLAEQMPVIAQQSSERERIAVDAERDTDALKKAEFMIDKVGQEFEAIISSVTSFGMFVELNNTVEGMIRLSALTDDYYHFHERQMALIGERTSKIYRLGDVVKVRLARVNMLDYTLDFEMLDQNGKAVRKSRFDEIISSLNGGKSASSGKGIGFKGKDKKRPGGNGGRGPKKDFRPGKPKKKR